MSAWWLLLAFFVGGYAGILLMALMSFAARSERAAEGRNARHGAALAGRSPDSAVDWVI